MISLKNITKVYTSQSKDEVVALKDVSFELGNSGMVCILGKSGSGKSTLLNLLGGLDQPTDGVITVDGVSMRDFKPSDYDGYRNGHVGFIFQEYNLLDDFNVKDNISIALRLSKNTSIDDKVIDALKQVELSQDYLTRRVGELSGGEKQRVAIARSIVKDSKMILADEPTGNLDSATGESIWNILKRLSKDKLVVVVSHDRENAEKYGDRVIEIADGSVVSDNGAVDVDSPGDKFTPQKMRLPFSDCFKMAFNSLFKRKFKAISIIVVSILCTFALTIAQMMLSFNPFKTEVRFVQKYDVPYVSVQQQVLNQGGEQVRGLLKSNSLQYIANNSTYIIGDIVENKQQILDFGLNFIGDAYELDSNSFYLTDKATKYIFNPRSDDYMLVDGQVIYLADYSGPIEDLIGKQMYLSLNDDSKENLPTLAGIIDTTSISRHISRDFFPKIFSRSDFIHRSLIWELDVNLSSNEVAFGLSGNTFNGYFKVIDEIDGGILVTENDFITDFSQIKEIQLADDEIVLTYEMYARLFSDAKSKFFYIDDVPYHQEADGTYVPQHYELTAIPEHVGEIVDVKFFDDEGNVLLDLGAKKLVGVNFKTFGDECNLSLSYSNYAKVVFAVQIQQVFIKVDSVKSIEGFLRTLNNEYNVAIKDVGSVMYDDGVNSRTVLESVDWFVDTANNAAMIFSIVGAVLLVVLILLVINLISFSITARRKEIGILSALGTSKGDIIKIFILEALFISIVSFVVTTILAVVLVNPLNHMFYSYMIDPIPFLRVDALTMAVIAVATFGLPLFAAWWPIRKLSNLKPVDAIRDV